MVTRKDIAERAQVSVSVVSRALNNSGYVDAKKREQILKIADELGYHPSPVAMSLMTQRTKQILFYCKDMRNAFNIEVYRGMLEAAEKQDYMVVVNGNLDFQKVKGIMADGLILPNDTIAELYLNTSGKRYHLPVVAASYGDPVSFTRSVPVVECDMWEGMNKVLNYLWEKGHRRIALVTPYVIEGTSARNLAWIDFMKERGGVINGRITFLGLTAGVWDVTSAPTDFQKKFSGEILWSKKISSKKGNWLPRCFRKDSQRQPQWSALMMRWHWDSASGCKSLDM